VSTPVTLPKMGESVVEGTIIRWLKKEGDRVTEDEPIVEISTDKIDTELPSPASGVLAKILVGPDETVEVGAELAVIEEGEAAEGETKEAPAAEKEQEPAAREPAPPTEQEPAARAPSVQESAGDGGAPGAVASPLVRKLARERSVDLSSVHGSGKGGRITKDDVVTASAGTARPGGTPPAPARRQEPVSSYTVPMGEHEDVAFDRIRQAIAKHMTMSLQTAAQLTNVVEVDVTRVAGLRARAKEDFSRREGFSLTFMPFIAAAVVQALRAFPEFNAHILEDGKTARLFREVNLGVAVGREEGLIVPVVHAADGMNLIGVARAIHDVGTRARTKGGLKPDDVVGGTISISNYGSMGGLMDTPIVSQPQVCILGTGAITKRPAVISVDGADAIAIRQMMFLSLTYDHRWIDGHKAALFNSRIKQILEEADFAHELGLDPDA